jgi:hypothetical protein
MPAHTMDSKIASIQCTVDVTLPAQRFLAVHRAFRTLFTEHFALWSPREYTWGRMYSRTSASNRSKAGFATNVGPMGFDLIWVGFCPGNRRTGSCSPGTSARDGSRNRIRPKASTIEVTFTASTPAQTRVDLEHRDFERPGVGAEEYREALALPKGWPSILDRYPAPGSIGGQFASTR